MKGPFRTHIYTPQSLCRNSGTIGSHKCNSFILFTIDAEYLNGMNGSAFKLLVFVYGAFEYEYKSYRK